MAIRDDFEVVAGQVRSAVQRFALGLLVIAAFGIMLVGKADTVLVEHARVLALDLASPVLEAIARPVAAANRATVLGAFWVPAERCDLVRAAYTDGSETAAADILRGWFESSGPRTAADYARLLALPRDVIDQALARLEAEGRRQTQEPARHD